MTSRAETWFNSDVASGTPTSSILVLAFAMLLCLINAALWTLYSDMPVAGLGWLLAAVGCVKLRRWSLF
jgi:hypothetical protein